MPTTSKALPTLDLIIPHLLPDPKNNGLMLSELLELFFEMADRCLLLFKSRGILFEAIVNIFH